jgi:hypothetical protein
MARARIQHELEIFADPERLARLDFTGLDYSSRGVRQFP